MAQVTVTDNEVRLVFSVGGSAQTDFAFPFTYYASSDIKVYDDGDLVDSGDYTINGNGSATDGYEGGTVVLDTGVTNTTIVVALDLTLAKTTNFPISADFSIAELNTELSRIWSSIQQINERYKRALKLPVTSGLVDGSGDVLDLEFNADPGDGQTIVYDATLKAFRSLTIDLANLEDVVDDAEAAQTAAEAAQAAAETAQTGAETAETNAETAQTAAEAARDIAVAASGNVKVSSNDTTAGDLEAKLLVSGSPLSLSTQNDGSNETRTITLAVANQAEAEAGTITNKVMTPQQTAQAIAAQVTAEGITEATAQATTSGTAFDFTSIPSGTKRIIMTFDAVSLSGSDELLVQIGDSGGIETTGYVANSTRVVGTLNTTSSTSGFNAQLATGAHTYTGHLILTRLNSASFTWVASGGGLRDTSGAVINFGKKTLSAELDRVRLTRSGTDTFDGGNVNITYE